MRLGQIVYLLIASVAAVLVLGALALVFELSYRPTYDQSDANYPHYLEVFEGLRPELESRGVTKDDYVDFSDLNKGEWKTACLFGGYTDPLKTMQLLGADIKAKDRLRLREAASRGLRLGQVDEQEMAIAFVDPGNNARFIHFGTGIGAEGQHLQKCISKPRTRLYLATP